MKYSAGFFVCLVGAGIFLIDCATAAASSASFGVGSGVGPFGYRMTPKNVVGRRRYSSSASSSKIGNKQKSYMPFDTTENDVDESRTVQQCSAASSGLAKNLARGAILRIASDITGGTPLESIKCQVTVTKDNMIEAYHNIVKESGFLGLWSGTPSRTVEGALMGALFILGSTTTKRQLIKMGAPKTVTALCAGSIGGLAQAIVMTPAGMIFTSLNVNRGKKGYENDNAIVVMKRIIQEKGIGGMFIGGGPMCLRQASNWASRAGFTEVARTTFKLTQYGMVGEIGSGIIGGIGSCWNTPIETIRVFMQRDISMGVPKKTFGQYWDDIVERDGYPGLFRGVTPRGIQAIWQTVFMVVVPNMLGM